FPYDLVTKNNHFRGKRKHCFYFKLENLNRLLFSTTLSLGWAYSSLGICSLLLAALPFPSSSWVGIAHL
ncbi:hypothetical protein, partial [Bacteroides fragilis]|uniref:hypothetical protein n=1 Tax=Bacteroides fragilis TaxID=817 RepID=UPI001C37A843